MQDKALQEIHARPTVQIAVVGSGEAFSQFTQLVCAAEFTEAFPWVKLVGFANIPQDTVRAIPQFNDLSVFKHYTDLFNAFGTLSMVIDATNDGQYLEGLRQAAPPNCSILRNSAALAISELLTSERLCHTCMRDLRRAQTLFTTLMNQVDENILLLDTKGRILDANDTVIASQGTTKEELLGSHCHTLTGGVFCCPHVPEECPLQETLTTGKRAERVHTRVDNDGRMQYFRVYTYPVHGKSDQISRIIEVRRDITNRTHMEQRLQQSEKLAAIGELSTYVAHEIRNPLFAIGGFANSLLRSKNLADEDREKVAIILEESKRLDGIVNNIINFARPSDAPKDDEFDLNRATAETLHLLRIGCEERGFTAKVHLAPNIAKARGNAEHVKQSLINLVKNGLEAMESGGHLSVITGMTQTHVFVTVSDTGCGIPEDIRDKIFSPFFSTKTDGAGLGLAMTKKIIEEMGGYVELTTQEEQGTSITLFLQPVLAVAPESPEH